MNLNKEHQIEEVLKLASLITKLELQSQQIDQGNKEAKLSIKKITKSLTAEATGRGKTEERYYWKPKTEKPRRRLNQEELNTRVKSRNRRLDIGHQVEILYP